MAPHVFVMGNLRIFVLLLIAVLLCIALLGRRKLWLLVICAALAVIFVAPRLLFVARQAGFSFIRGPDSFLIQPSAHSGFVDAAGSDLAVSGISGDKRVSVTAGAGSWSQAMDRMFATAKLHPSGRAAAQALAWQVQDWAAAHSEQPPPALAIQIAGQASRSAIKRLVDLLSQSFADAQIDVPETPAAVSAGDPFPKGVLTVTVRSAANQTGPPDLQARAGYTNKTWINAFDAFVSDRTNRTWVVAYSQAPATGPHGAQEQAMAAAAAKMVPLLRDYLRSHSSQQARQFSRCPDYVLAEQIVCELRAGGLIQDRFAQSVQRPYGHIWREAVLVDATGSNIVKMGPECIRRLESLRADVLDSWRSRRAGWRQTAFSIAGLLILICLVYLALNAMTKGYYTWSLRMAAVVLAAAGILFVFTVFAR